MGCISSTQHELGADARINVNPPNPINDIPEDAPRLQSIELPSNHDNNHPHANPSTHTPQSLPYQQWNTDDLISYICCIADGKFCDPKYDVFKTGLKSLGINGKTINALCHDPLIFHDLDMPDETDVLLIQTAFVQLYSNNDNYNKNSININDKDNKDNKNDENDEFFPLKWKFPLENSEIIENHHYVGEALLITSKLHQIPSKCIYVENNWIVIQYKNIKSVLTSDNIYKDMERIHVIKEKARISKINESNKHKLCGDDNSDNSNGLFEKEYYGLSFQYSLTSIVGIVPPDCYIDPITYEIMSDPLTSKTSGRTYDKSVIMEHVEHYGTDPFTQQPMTINDLYNNRDLKRAIHRWLKNNPQVNNTMG